MYFIANDAWEVRNPVVKSRGSSSSRLFSCIEVDLNFALWHLDILISLADGVTFWRRFVLTSLSQTVAKAAGHPGRSWLHYQSALSIQNGAYQWQPVLKILAGQATGGLSAYLLVFPHGSEIYAHHHLKNDEFAGARCVYEAGNFD